MRWNDTLGGTEGWAGGREGEGRQGSHSRWTGGDVVDCWEGGLGGGRKGDWEDGR